MKKAQWSKRIRQATVDAGTYRTYFEDAIESLAIIMERRDEVEKVYIEQGSQPIIIHTNKGGADNMVKNPALVLWDDLNKTALSYWRDLGLTPAGLKKLKEDALKDTGKVSFGDIIEGL
jgi:hypothetical protein